MKKTTSKKNASHQKTSSAKSASGRSRGGSKKRASKKKKRMMIFGIEIAVILILVLGFWVVSKLDKIQKPKVEQDQIEVNESLQESTMETISLLARRLQDEYRFMGEWMLSVMVITLAFLSLANSMAFRVLMEYLGKLIPITASFSPTRIICSNISDTLVVFISTTLPRIIFK